MKIVSGFISQAAVFTIAFILMACAAHASTIDTKPAPHQATWNKTKSKDGVPMGITCSNTGVCVTSPGATAIDGETFMPVFLMGYGSSVEQQCDVDITWGDGSESLKKVKAYSDGAIILMSNITEKKGTGAVMAMVGQKAFIVHIKCPDGTDSNSTFNVDKSFTSWALKEMAVH